MHYRVTDSVEKMQLFNYSLGKREKIERKSVLQKVNLNYSFCLEVKNLQTYSSINLQKTFLYSPYILVRYLAATIHLDT